MCQVTMQVPLQPFQDLGLSLLVKKPLQQKDHPNGGKLIKSLIYTKRAHTSSFSVSSRRLPCFLDDSGASVFSSAFVSGVGDMSE